MNKITLKNLVPMSKEELKIRGLKNIRRNNGFCQLHYIDGFGNDEILIEGENESFGMKESWSEYMKKNLGIVYINQKRIQLNQKDEIKHLRIDLTNSKNNSNRFQNYLTTIVTALGIDWWDGDFPIGDVLEKIKGNKK